MSEEMFANLLAISESTPGPIMVNTATYIGSMQGGILGAMIATFSVVIPAFFIMIAVAILMKNLVKNKYFKAVQNGVQPCIMGLILATGVYFTYNACLGLGEAPEFDVIAIAILIILIAITTLYKRLRKKEFSPILLIIVSAICGGLTYGFFS
jgi:chromate transporter